MGHGETDGNVITVYMGGILHTLREVEDDKHMTEPQRSAYVARKASAVIAHESRHRVEDIVMGDEALKREQAAYERPIIVRRMIPETIGALAASLATSATAVENAARDSISYPLVALGATVVAGAVVALAIRTRQIRDRIRGDYELYWLRPGEIRAAVAENRYTDRLDAGEQPMVRAQLRW